MIQVDVHSRHYASVVLVLELGKLLTQQPYMVVIHDRHRSNHICVGLLRALLHQFGPRQIAKRLRSVRVTPLFHQFVELIQQFTFDRHPKTPQVRHTAPILVNSAPPGAQIQIVDAIVLHL